MKQIKDLLIERLNSTNTVISERLILNKQATKQEYFFHKEIGVAFKNNTRMRLYSISTSEDQEDRDSMLGFVIISPYDLTYEDTLGRTIQCKAMGAIKYDDVENNVDDIILNDLVKAELIEDKDDCIISYPSIICDSLAMQLPKIIAQSLVAVLSNLYNNKFFGGFFGKHFLQADWYTRR